MSGPADRPGTQPRPEASGGLLAEGSVLYHLSDAVLTTDMDLRITGWNPAAADLYGWAADEVLGQLVCVLLQADDEGMDPAAFSQYLSEHGAWSGSVLHRHRDGRPLTILASVTLVRSAAGAPAAIVTINRDISAREVATARLYAQARRDLAERRRAEQELEAERARLAQIVEERTTELRLLNAELNSVLRLKDEFLATMSHELRTPLNSVLGRAEGMREALYGPVSERQLEAIEGIIESGRNLLALINDILDFSQLEAGQLQLVYEPLEVGMLCARSTRAVVEVARRKGISLTSSLDARVAVITADERRLRQILINLLSNAVKFTPVGGAVGLEVRGDPAQGKVTFTVWDTGIGIAEEHLLRLFQPFVQLDSRLSRQYPGTGLGLALVRRLAELHGGSVTVTSVPGEGSRFSVTLPL